MDTMEKLTILKKNAETTTDVFIKRIAGLERRVKVLEKLIEDFGMVIREGGTNGTAKP